VREAEAADARFELALTQEALLRIDVCGGAGGDVEARTAEIADRLLPLGIVATPEVPLGVA
jgi:hypothetical protein